MGALRPRIAVLDEIDSGLDVDALRAVAHRVGELSVDPGVGVLAITHYNRLLSELPVSTVHVLSAGRVVVSGGPELALELEGTGYVAYEEQAGQP
jgi:Fe-S cluster assembly ATP-binding protein